jgi:hypothetical protein
LRNILVVTDEGNKVDSATLLQLFDQFLHIEDGQHILFNEGELVIGTGSKDELTYVLQLIANEILRIETEAPFPAELHTDNLTFRIKYLH